MGGRTIKPGVIEGAIELVGHRAGGGMRKTPIRAECISSEGAMVKGNFRSPFRRRTRGDHLTPCIIFFNTGESAKMTNPAATGKITNNK